MNKKYYKLKDDAESWGYQTTKEFVAYGINKDVKSITFDKKTIIRGERKSWDRETSFKLIFIYFNDDKLDLYGEVLDFAHYYEEVDINEINKDDFVFIQ